MLINDRHSVTADEVTAHQQMTRFCRPEHTHAKQQHRSPRGCATSRTPCHVAVDSCSRLKINSREGAAAAARSQARSTRSSRLMGRGHSFTCSPGIYSGGWRGSHTHAPSFLTLGSRVTAPTELLLHNCLGQAQPKYTIYRI